MRLRTLPVSVAGVLCAFAYALFTGGAQWLPGVLCLIFAVLAQISSNFANEYYDFKGGLDKKGRVGPRRGVTEGDISAGAMKAAREEIKANDFSYSWRTTDASKDCGYDYICQKEKCCGKINVVYKWF